MHAYITCHFHGNSTLTDLCKPHLDILNTNASKIEPSCDLQIHVCLCFFFTTWNNRFKYLCHLVLKTIDTVGRKNSKTDRVVINKVFTTVCVCLYQFKGIRFILVIHTNVSLNYSYWSVCTGHCTENLTRKNKHINIWMVYTVV